MATAKHAGAYLELSILRFLVLHRRPGTIKQGLHQLFLGNVPTIFYDPLSRHYLLQLAAKQADPELVQSNIAELFDLMDPISVADFVRWLRRLYDHYGVNQNSAVSADAQQALPPSGVTSHQVEAYLPALAAALAADAVLLTEHREFKGFEPDWMAENLEVIVIEY